MGRTRDNEITVTMGCKCPKHIAACPAPTSLPRIYHSAWQGAGAQKVGLERISEHQDCNRSDMHANLGLSICTLLFSGRDVEIFQEAAVNFLLSVPSTASYCSEMPGYSPSIRVSG